MKYLCYTQIRNFKCSISCEQKVTWFNVLVNYTLTVQVFQSLHELTKIPSTNQKTIY